MNDAREDHDVEAVGVLAEPVRRQLYEYVAGQRHAVSRDEAATATGISRILAAFHLDKLVERGLLIAEFRRLTGRSGRGAGRPAKLYRRGPREIRVELPQRRYELAAEVFATALERLGPEATEAVTEAATDLGRRIGREANDADVATDGRHERLLDVLRDLGFEPFPDGDAVIRLANCPFHAIRQTHLPLACGMNLAFGQGLADGLQAEGLCPRLDPQPGTCCVVLERCDGAVRPTG